MPPTKHTLPTLHPSCTHLGGHRPAHNAEDDKVGDALGSAQRAACGTGVWCGNDCIGGLERGATGPFASWKKPSMVRQVAARASPGPGGRPAPVVFSVYSDHRQMGLACRTGKQAGPGQAVHHRLGSARQQRRKNRPVCPGRHCNLAPLSPAGPARWQQCRLCPRPRWRLHGQPWSGDPPHERRRLHSAVPAIVHRQRIDSTKSQLQCLAESERKLAVGPTLPPAAGSRAA